MQFSQHPGMLFFLHLHSQAKYYFCQDSLVHQPLYLADSGSFNFYGGDQFVFEHVLSLSIFCLLVPGW